MFDNEDIEMNDRETDIKEKDEQNIDLSMTDFYSYIVAIMQMHWKE